MFDELCHCKLKDIGDFEWQRFIRPYLKQVDSNTDSNLNSSSEQELYSEDSTRSSTVILRCLDQEIEYGFEYLGCASMPVVTSRANNYIISFTQVSTDY